MRSMSPLITAVPPPIFVDHDKTFLDIFLNLCMRKANLTSITSLRMQLYCLIEILKQQQLKPQVGSMRLQLQLHDAIHQIII